MPRSGSHSRGGGGAIAYDVVVINSVTVSVLERNPSDDVLRCFGTTVPTDASSGFAVGASFIKTNGSAGSTLYTNEGSATSSDFNLVQSAGADGAIQMASVSLTNTNMLALRATPVELVAAPGAGKISVFLRAELMFDYTAAYTETTDNMAIRYTDGSGVVVSGTIEATGFVDATADTATGAIAVIDGIVAKTGADNKALVIHNTGDGEYGGGNAANVIRVRTFYMVVAAGW